MARTKEILSKARDLFNATHWIKGHMSLWGEYEEKMGYCLIGGLRFKADHDPENMPDSDEEYASALKLVTESLLEGSPGSYHADRAQTALEKWDYEESLYDRIEAMEDTLISWNDENERRLEEILDLLDRAESKVPA